MLKVYNTRVYGLEESFVAGGYPMMTEHPTGAEFDSLCDDIDIARLTEGENVNEYGEKRIKSSKKLGNVPTGTGHDNFLKGIIVQHDVVYPQYWTPQFQRYSFHDIVSSNSKMHRITKMNIDDVCNEYVDDRVKEILKDKIDFYNTWLINKKVTIEANNLTDKQWKDETYRRYMNVVANIPAGLEQFMRVTSTYLQLKTIYLQRMNHKLVEDWGSYCAWCESLPDFVELCLNGKRKFTDENGKVLDEKHNWK